jgi:mitogen-activated protein kinase kinase
MPPRPIPPRIPGRSVLPPMSRPGGLPPMSGTPSPGRSPVPVSSPSPGGMRNRPGMGRMGRPGLNLSQLGLSPKPEQTPFANFSKYV